MRHHLPILPVLFLLAGCGTAAVDPVHVKLTPNVPVVSVNIANGAKLFLQTSDERSENERAGQKEYETVAPLLPADDFVAVFQELLADRLTALGFVPLIAPHPSSPRLNIALTKLRYGRYSTKPARVYIETSVSVTAHKNNACVIEKLYSRTYEEAGASAKQAWLDEKTSSVLSQLVEKILADVELLAALK